MYVVCQIKIEKRYSLQSSPLHKLTKSPHHKSNKMTNKGKVAEQIFTKESLNGELPRYESFYTKETTELVKTIYQKDFDIYGYSPDSLGGVNSLTFKIKVCPKSVKPCYSRGPRLVMGQTASSNMLIQ